MSFINYSILKGIKIFLNTSLLIVTLVLLPKCIFSQYILNFGPSDKFFNLSDGLPSNQIYGAIQDRNGFIWTYSDKGINKFDGFSFKTINTTNKLKTSNIWLLTQDYYGRIWLSKHDNTLSYLTDDSIVVLNKFINDIPIGKITYLNKDTSFFHLSDMVLALRSSLKDVNIIKEFKLDSSKANLVYLDNDWISKKLKSLVDLQINYNALVRDYYSNSYSCFLDSILYIRNNNSDTIYIINTKINQLIRSEYFKNQYFYTPYEDVWTRDVGLSHTSGHLVYHKGAKKSSFYYNTSLGVNRSLYDKNGNLWVCTKNAGLYFACRNKLTLNTKLLFNDQNLNTYNVNNNLIIESLYSKFQLYNNFTLVDTLSLNGVKGFYPWFDNSILVQGNFLPSIYNPKSGIITLKKYLTNYQNTKIYINPISSIQISKDSIVYSTYDNQVILLTRLNKQINNKLIHQDVNRILNISRVSSNYLYYFTNESILQISLLDLTTNKILPVFNKDTLKISAIGSFNNLGITGTSGQGLFIIENNKILNKITGTDGINFTGLFQLSNYLIAHTNKGIFSYIFKDGEFKFNTVYANSYGLNPDDIKLVYPYNDSIHVVTKNSILAFSPSLIDTTQDTLRVYECLVDNQKVSLEKTVLIPHDFKQLSFRFSTFNYTRMDDTKFRYRFNSSDSWIVLASNLIELSQLASGEYILEIEAFNKYSNEILANALVPMKVLTPWYKSTLFIILANALFIGLIFLLYRRRLEQRKKIEDNIKSLEYSLRESKIKVLENQMNPHFLFNSLTSIKAFIKDNDIKNADYYLGYFSKLMRLYLDSSRSSRISIRDEVELVKHYLILERMRFEERFDFEIYVDPRLDIESLMIPTMMIQPIVENSIRHGLFNRKSGGKLNLNIIAENQDVIIEINDNGVGIAKSLELKSEVDRTHQSHATRIIKEKIELLNNTMNYQIVVNTADLDPNNPEYKGTRTIIRLIKLIE